MESIVTRVSVSSSLTGKDLWIVKTFIANKFSPKNLDLNYIDDQYNCDIFITQDTLDGKKRYCAILKKTNTRLPILPYLNPVTLKKLFLFLGKEDSIQRYQLNFTKKNISNFQIYKFLNYSGKQLIEINHKEFHLILDSINDRIYCSRDLNGQFVMLLKNTSIESLKVLKRDNNEGVLNSNYEQKSLSSFKWEMGIVLHECFFEKKSLDNWQFEQTDWPDYGDLNVKKDFVQLSALLSYQAISYKELIAQFQKEVVHSFLNAMYLTNKVQLTEFKAEKKHHNTNDIEQVKHSGFLVSFKTFLNKIHF